MGFIKHYIMQIISFSFTDNDAIQPKVVTPDGVPHLSHDSPQFLHRPVNRVDSPHLHSIVHRDSPPPHLTHQRPNCVANNNTAISSSSSPIAPITSSSSSSLTEPFPPLSKGGLLVGGLFHSGASMPPDVVPHSSPLKELTNHHSLQRKTPAYLAAPFASLQR